MREGIEGGTYACTIRMNFACLAIVEYLAYLSILHISRYTVSSPDWEGDWGREEGEGEQERV